MNIKYSKQSIKFLKKQDTTTRQRIVDAIETVSPDDWDIKMLNNLDAPDCHEFVSSEDAMKELGLN